MDVDTVVGILGIIAIVVGAWIPHRDPANKRISDMVDSEGKMHERLDDLSKKVDRLYDANFEMERQLHDYRRRDLEQVDYIRSIGHWLSAACKAMHIDAKWAEDNPKPKLPESIRAELPPERRHLDSKEDKK